MDIRTRLLKRVILEVSSRDQKGSKYQLSGTLYAHSYYSFSYNIRAPTINSLYTNDTYMNIICSLLSPQLMGGVLFESLNGNVFLLTWTQIRSICFILEYRQHIPDFA